MGAAAWTGLLLVTKGKHKRRLKRMTDLRQRTGWGQLLKVWLPVTINPPMFNRDIDPWDYLDRIATTFPARVLLLTRYRLSRNVLLRAFGSLWFRYS